MLKTNRDPGVTNVRNAASPHWRCWFRPANRCLIAVTSFTEPKAGGNQWFAPVDTAVQMYFSGIELRGWTSVRKVKDGLTIDDLYAILTSLPNTDVGAVHSKAMPVILMTRGVPGVARHAHRDLGAPAEVLAGRQPEADRGGHLTGRLLIAFWLNAFRLLYHVRTLLA